MCRGSQYPTGWKETTLGDLAHYINGYAFRPEDWKKVGLPIIRIQQINDPEAEYDCFDGPIADQYRIDSGDLLFSWSATLTTLIWNRGPAVLNQHIFKVIPREGADLHFLHHLLEYLMDELAGQTHGSTMRHIKRSDLLPFPVVVPPPEEQRCIAEILDAADEAIRQTERVIAKLKAVKAGLLHDLLTRGLDEHGHLRDPQAHLEQFKDSPLGRIPREWEVVRCTSICHEITVGIVIRPSQYYVSEGIPALRSANVREDGVILDDLVFISEESNRLLAKSRLKQGDVITVRTGYPGTSCVVPPELDGANCIDLIISRLGPRVIPEYLATWINSDFGKGQVLRSQGGLAQQHFNVGALQKLLVALPKLDEQNRIAAILDAHDARIRAEEGELAKLRQVKRGLMDDLLTGRVRVT